MQGPYTVCKEHPAMGGSNTARPPNIEGSLKGERKAGPSAALGIPPSTLPGRLGLALPGATTLRWENSLRNCYARRLLRSRRRRPVDVHISSLTTVDEPTPLEGRNVSGMGAVTRVTGPTPDMQAPGEGVSAWHERAVHERDLWRCSVARCGKTPNAPWETSFPGLTH
jgi:hypothetical protein